MEINKISYGKTYGLPNYGSERIDVEASVDQTDNIAQVFDMLKGICDGQHKLNNPHLYDLSINAEVWKQHTNEPLPQNIPITNSEPTQNLSPEQALKEQIDSANDLKGLEWLKPILKKVPQLQEYYDQKHEQLTQNQ